MRNAVRARFLMVGTLGLMQVALLGCLSDPPAAPIPPEELTFAPQLGVILSTMTRTQTGLYYLDESTGEGPEARIGDRAAIHYTGWLHDGQQFDTNVDDTPLRFCVGLNDPFIDCPGIIFGIHEGVLGMHEGGHRLVVIPSQLAYGQAGAGNGAIPPNATLVFRIELLEIEADESN